MPFVQIPGRPIASRTEGKVDKAGIKLPVLGGNVLLNYMAAPDNGEQYSKQGMALSGLYVLLIGSLGETLYINCLYGPYICLYFIQELVQE